jgi:hypothetical protein
MSNPGGCPIASFFVVSEWLKGSISVDGLFLPVRITDSSVGSIDNVKPLFWI